MYDVDTRKHALRLLSNGRSLNSVSKETGISRSAIRAWQVRLDPLPRVNPTPCSGPGDRAAYAYLLGLYLGDGCISSHPRGGHYLRIACADAWPGLIEQCRAAIQAVRPSDKVYVLQRQGCVNVTSYGRHWTCLFPQHGPGKKHERPIALEGWQQEIVDAHPWEFVRGLIHSDGCRITNWTVRNGKRYEYPGTSSPTSPTISGSCAPTPSPRSASGGPCSRGVVTPSTSPSRGRNPSPSWTPTSGRSTDPGAA